MKHLLRLLLYLGSIACLFACNQNELDSLQEQINALKSDQLATINAQVSSINLSIQMLQSTDTDLKSYIQTLQEQLPALQEADAELDKRIDALKTALKDDVSVAKAEVLAELGAYKTSVNNQIKALNEAVSLLQDKDAALVNEIGSLKEYVDKQLASSKDWAAATFATLVQFNDLSEDVAGIKVSVTGLQDDLKKTNEDLAKAAEDLKASIASLDASIQQQIADLTTNFNDALSSATDKITAEYQAAIGKAIQDSEASIKKWINEQLTGYYTIAETDEKLDALQKTLEGQLNTQKAYLEDLISSLSTTLTQKIEENRTLIDKLSTNADTQSQLISANATAISSNAEAILQNAENITKNAGDIETCNQLIAANLSLIEQNQKAIETNAGRLKDLDGQVSSNVTAIAKNAENIAQNAALISTNATAISNNAAAITQNASDILQLRSSLTTTKKEITDAYTEAISKAISQLDGKLSSQMTSEINIAVSNLESSINEKIAGLTKRVTDIEDDIKGIHTQISAILADIASIHESITDLLNRIQSITVIPTVSDGSVAINRYYNDFNFEVYPLSVAQKLPELSLPCFSMRAAQTIQTKSDISFTDMPVSKVSYADGILTVTASAANFDLDFFAGEHGESARLLITYDNVNISSGYFSLSPSVSSGDIDIDTPLTIEAIETGSISIDNPNNLFFKYCINGSEWVTSNESSVDISMRAKDVISFFGDNTTLNVLHGMGPLRIYSRTTKYYAYGNVMSLLDSKYFPVKTEIDAPYALSGLFGNEANLLYSHPTKKLCLPATKLTNRCYQNMFYGCSNMTVAPELPATNLEEGCYEGMFARCSALTDVQEELPATILAQRCYAGMFSSCASLTKAPVLPAEELVKDCYQEMFYGCSSLNYIKALFTSDYSSYYYYNGISGEDSKIRTYTDHWVRGVSSTGTFIKNPALRNVLRGDHYIPAGWTIEDVNNSFVDVESVTLNKVELELTIGENETLIATVKPDNVNDGTVRWTTTDAEIATVDDAGKVTALKPGTATIKAEAGEKSATCSVVVVMIPEGAVDLGIVMTREDGSTYRVFWAKCNLGADSETDYGDYYAWGETETKSKYTWSTYRWAKGEEKTLIKYCPTNETDSWEGTGSPDNKTALDPEDDVAHVTLGGKWRMPTRAEWVALMNTKYMAASGYSWTWCDGSTEKFNESTTPGWKVVRKSTSATLFLPAAGMKGGELNSSGLAGFYWSSSLCESGPNDAKNAYFYSGGPSTDERLRYLGLSVRPVTE